MNTITGLIKLLWATRGSLFTLLLTIISLGLDQSADALRRLADESNTQLSTTSFFVISLLLFSWNLFYWTHFIIYKRGDSIVAGKFLESCKKNLAIFYSSLLFFTVLTFYIISFDFKIFNLNLTCFLAISILIVGIVQVAYMHHVIYKNSAKAFEKEVKFTWLFMLFLWLFMLFLSLTKSQWAIFLGPVGILMITFAIWCSFLTFFVFVKFKTQIPLLLILFLYGFLLNFFDLNDNTAIQCNSERKAREPFVLGQAFTEWLDTRPDLSDYPNGYPVFIVSIEGGGIRSSYMGAQVLSRIQDHEPRFAHHVFAISGVSGGSVGSSIFAALCDQYISSAKVSEASLQWDQMGALETLSDKILSKDLLSPVLLTALYANLFQSLVPFPIKLANPALALEHSLEDAWKDATGTSKFSENFYSIGRGVTSKSTPALFLNTTSVSTGERMVLSSLYPLEENYGRFISLYDLNPFTDMPLSTASILSARFPGLTPSGFLTHGLDQKGDILGKERFVDGGYYENSGCATALDIINALQYGQFVSGRHKFYPVVLRIGYKENSINIRNSLNEKIEPEAASPLKALFRGRSGRGNDAANQLRSAMIDIYNREIRLEQDEQRLDRFLGDEGMIEFLFNDTDLPIPLGWVLSGQSRRAVKNQILKPKKMETSFHGDTQAALQQVIDRLHFY